MAVDSTKLSTAIEAPPSTQHNACNQVAMIRGRIPLAKHGIAP